MNTVSGFFFINNFQPGWKTQKKEIVQKFDTNEKLNIFTKTLMQRKIAQDWNWKKKNNCEEKVKI